MLATESTDLITVQEAAERFGLTVPQIRGWIRERRIRVYQQDLPRRLFVDAKEIQRKRTIREVSEGGEGA